MTSFTNSGTVRLISTAYIDEPAMAPLVDDAIELAFLESVEALTSARLSPDIAMPPSVDPHELLTEHAGYGWTYVNAAFCHTRPEGNRFSGPDRGAWYAAWSEATLDEAAETAKMEVSWHLGRELAATGIFENLTAYRELLAGVMADLHDLRGMPDPTFLDPEIAVGHQAGQELAAALFASGSNGVLYPSVRRETGQCLAVFRPHLVQNVRQGRTWMFEWRGSGEPEISLG